VGKTRAALIATARAHLAEESKMDVAGTLATMQSPWFYEVWPGGLRMEGEDLAREYYEFHFSTLRPRMIGAVEVGEWEDERGLVIERDVDVRLEDGSVETFRVLAVLALGDDGVTGERIYADGRFHRLIFGDLLDREFRPVRVP
jgi:hypothetical protein